MISLSATARALVDAPTGYVMHLRVESRLGGRLLASDIPIDSGGETTDSTATVPERINLTVPRTYAGVSWSPTSDTHPLAARGQRLRVSLGIELAQQRIEWIPRGEFVIRESNPTRDGVSVEALGLLSLIEEARFVSPFQPSGTLKSTLRALLEPAITVVFSSGLADRSVPSGINFDENRLGAVRELLDAWPATMRITETGYALVESPDTANTTPNLTLTSANTLPSDGAVSDRDDMFNVVVARGTTSDGTQVQGVAYAPIYGGPFNPLPVPLYFSSPLLTSSSQCRDAARTLLARKLRESSTPITVEVPPRPDVQAGDVGAYAGKIYGVVALKLPYVPDGGPMALTLVELT